jgi:hypothetical protein
MNLMSCVSVGGTPSGEKGVECTGPIPASSTSQSRQPTYSAPRAGPAIRNSFVIVSVGLPGAYHASGRSPESALVNNNHTYLKHFQGTPRSALCFWWGGGFAQKRLMSFTRPLLVENGDQARRARAWHSATCFWLYILLCVPPLHASDAQVAGAGLYLSRCSSACATLHEPGRLPSPYTSFRIPTKSSGAFCASA